MGHWRSAGDQRAFGGRQRRQRRDSGLGDLRRILSRDVGRDHRPRTILGDLHERSIVRRVARPGTAGLQKVLLAVLAAQIGVERRLHITLEHLEGDRHRHVPPHEPLEKGGLEAVRVRIVVLLADEHDIDAGQVREHRLEVGEGPASGVEHAFGHVRREDWLLRRPGRDGQVEESEGTRQRPRASGRTATERACRHSLWRRTGCQCESDSLV